MVFARKVFFYIPVLLFLLTAVFVKAQTPIAIQPGLPKINCLTEALPLTFSWINFDYPPGEVPFVVKEKVNSIITDFCLESNGGDSTELPKAKDYYFNTIRLPLNNMQLYVVILKTPLSYSHCKLFLYDSVSNTASKKVVDYNTWAMYAIEDNGMKRSDVFKESGLNSDDMSLVQRKQSNLLVRRLKHNGTFNELEEITYHANGLSLDTVTNKSRRLDVPEDK